MTTKKLLDEDEKRECIEAHEVASFSIKPLEAKVIMRQFDMSRDLVIKLYRFCEEHPDELLEIKRTQNLRPEDLRKASRLLEKAADEIQNLKTTRHDKQ